MISLVRLLSLFLILTYSIMTLNYLLNGLMIISPGYREAALETARDLHGAGVMKKTTLRQIEELCLPPRRDFNSDDIKRIRLANNLSQGVFAVYLCVGVSTVQQWEQGHKKPTGSAARPPRPALQKRA